MIEPYVLAGASIVLGAMVLFAGYAAGQVAGPKIMRALSSRGVSRDHVWRFGMASLFSLLALWQFVIVVLLMFLTN